MKAWLKEVALAAVVFGVVIFALWQTQVLHETKDLLHMAAAFAVVVLIDALLALLQKRRGQKK